MSQVTFEKIRENYKRVCEGSNPQPRRIAVDIAEQIGLCDRDGHYHRREDGFPMLAKDRKKRVADFPLDLLAEAIIGRDWKQMLGLGTPGEAFPVRRWLSEEAAAPIGPSHFMNVSAWTAAAGGLVRGSVLEGYETSDFDLADLFPTRPVVFWQGGERYVDIVGPAEPAPKVGPGEDYPDARLDSLWVEPGPMAKYAQKITVAKETAFVDISGGKILASARNIGSSVRFRENELVLDVLMGQTNNFKLGITDATSATGYNTYGATVPTGNGTTGTLGNDIVNPMVDPITTFQASDDALTVYKHPVTGLPMPFANRLNTVIVPTTLNAWAQWLSGLADITVLNQPGLPAPAPAGTFPTGSMTGPNPYRNRFQVRVSQWVYDRHTRSTTQTNPNISPGLGLSAANARRWYRLDPARFAARRAAWDLNTIDLNPNDYIMATQGIIFGQAVDIAVQVQVLNPWAIQRNKVA